MKFFLLQNVSRNEASSSSCRLPRCICGCDQLSRQDIDRFTDRLENVLNSRNGTEVFLKYLRHNNFGESVKCVEFWRLCNEYRMAEPGEKPKILMDIQQAAQDVDELDFVAVERLNNCVEQGVVKETNNCIIYLQTTVIHLLRQDYDKFRDYLLKKINR